jgi:hypothetical protein
VRTTQRGQNWKEKTKYTHMDNSAGREFDENAIGFQRLR